MEVPFVGRQENLLKLTEQFYSNKIIIVHGLKSIGKTRTVSEFMKVVRENESIIEEISINLTDRNIQEPIFLRLSTLLKLNIVLLDEWEENTVSIITAFKQNADVKFLIMIDNCEHIFEGPESLQKHFKTFVLKLINATENIHIIIVTSVLTTDFDGECFRVELQPLSFLESCNLLRTFVTGNEKYSEHVEKVAQLCLGLPLALIMVGAELKDNSIEDIAEFLLYSRVKALSSEFYPAKERADFSYGSLLKKLSPELKYRLADLEYIPGSFQIQQAMDVIGDGCSTDTATSSLAFLRQRHIVSEETSKHRFNIHGILRDCIKMYLAIKDIPSVRSRFCRTYAALMKHISTQMNKTEYIEAISQFSLEYPNFQKLLQEVNYATSDTFHVFIDIVMSSADLLHNYMGGEAVQFYQQCLELIPLHGTKKDEAILKWGFGEILTYEKANLFAGEESYTNALNLVSDDPLCPLHVQVRSSFGVCLWRAGKQSQSINELQRALDEASSLGMRNEPTMTTCIRHLAMVHAYYNAHVCEKYHKEALKRIIEYHGNENNSSVAVSFNYLGICFQSQGKNEEALRYFEKALFLKRLLKVPANSLVLTLNNVAMRYSYIGRKYEACALLQEALLLLERSNSENMNARLATYENYGCLQQSLHNYKEALPYIDEVISVRRIHSPLSPNIFEMFELKGINCMHCKQYDHAASCFEQVIMQKHVILEQRPLNLLVYFCYIRLMECYAYLKDKEEFIKTCKATYAEIKRIQKEQQKIGTYCILLDSFQSVETRFFKTLHYLKTIIPEWIADLGDHILLPPLDVNFEMQDTNNCISAREQTLNT